MTTNADLVKLARNCGAIELAGPHITHGDELLMRPRTIERFAAAIRAEPAVQPEAPAVVSVCARCGAVGPYEDGRFRCPICGSSSAAPRAEASQSAAPKDCGEYGHDTGVCGNASCSPQAKAQPTQAGSDARLHGVLLDDLSAIADGLDGYEKTINVGNTTGNGDTLLKSTTAAAAEFIRAAVAAFPPAEPTPNEEEKP